MMTDDKNKYILAVCRLIIAFVFAALLPGCDFIKERVEGGLKKELTKVIGPAAPLMLLSQAGQDEKIKLYDISNRKTLGFGGKDYRIPLTWIKEYGINAGSVKYGEGDYGRIIKSGGKTRFYEIHIPPQYNQDKPAPVVLVLHGGGGYPAAVRYQSEMDKISDKNDFIVVYPAGTGKLYQDRLLTWNDGRPDRHGNPLSSDDVGFISKVLDDIASLFDVDPNRIYACGISNGALMTYRLAKQLPNRIAAISTVAGHRAADDIYPPPPRPISIMQFSGIKDKLTPYYGGSTPPKIGPFTIDFLTTLKPVKEVIKSWVLHNKCPQASLEKRIGKAVETRYALCQDNTEVILWTLENGGHTWPGGKQTITEKRLNLGNINTDINASELMWEFFKKHHKNLHSNSSSINSSNMQKTDRVLAMYDYYEQECLKKGWQKVTVRVNNSMRKLLWKEPGQSWNRGAIIAMHGGGGTYSNFCSGPAIGKPMEKFSKLAISQGFAIFSLDSRDGEFRDAKGNSCGKRWESIARDDKTNPDLDFIKIVITDTIPTLRPANSAKTIFLTGISNGGFMSILAGTDLDDKIRAFAPVSAGDPYGTDINCSKKEGTRLKAPGFFFDNETLFTLDQKGACTANDYLNEKKWRTTNHINKPFFKQFHNEGDGACNISCMEKTRTLLTQHGYKDDTPFIVKARRKSLLNHFWMKEYNQPIIDFFTKYSE